MALGAAAKTMVIAAFLSPLDTVCAILQLGTIVRHGRAWFHWKFLTHKLTWRRRFHFGLSEIGRPTDGQHLSHLPNFKRVQCKKTTMAAPRTTTTTTVPPFVAAISLGLVAVAPTSLVNEGTVRVFLYRDDTGLLQTTLTAPTKPKHHVHPLFSDVASHPLLHLAFLYNTEDADGNGDGTVAEPTALVAASSRGFVVWDLTRGVVSGSIALPSNVELVEVRSIGPDLYVLVRDTESSSSHRHHHHQRAVVYHYQDHASRLSRKIKTKHADRLAVTRHHLVAVGGSKGRIHDLHTGKVLHKVSLPSRATAVAVVLHEASSSHPQTVATAAILLDTGSVLRIRLDDGTMEPFAATGVALPTSSAPPSLEWAGQCLLLHGRYAIDASSSSAESDTVTAPTPLWNAADAEAGSVHFLPRVTNRVTAVLYRAGSIRVRSGLVTDAPFAWSEEDGTEGENTSAPKGREVQSSTNLSRPPQILGPAHAGSAATVVDEASHRPAPKKKARIDSGDAAGTTTAVDDEAGEGGEDEGATVAARLALLRKQMDADDAAAAEEELQAARRRKSPAASAASGTFQPKKATTESLSQLLRQALSDDSMLELCLQVRDPAILQESVASLETDDLASLVTTLTVRLAQKPGRADALAAWLQALLMTRRVPLAALLPLQNLLQERIEVFPALLKLEGRLCMLGT